MPGHDDRTPTEAKPARRALIVAHETDGLGGQVAVRLAERGLTVETHCVTPDRFAPNEAEPFPVFGDYDLVVLMGSIRSLTNKAEIDSWVDTELDLIRAAHDAGQPMLGICFGGQLLADALGGSVEASPVTEIGWHPIDATAEADNPAGPGPWMEWHHDRFTPPPGATVLANTDAGAQLFSIGNVVGTQFHPEVDAGHVAQWIANAGDDYLNQHGQNGEALLADAKANEARNIEQCHDFVDWFLDSVAFPDSDTATSDTATHHIATSDTANSEITSQHTANLGGAAESDCSDQAAP